MNYQDKQTKIDCILLSFGSEIIRAYEQPNFATLAQEISYRYNKEIMAIVEPEPKTVDEYVNYFEDRYGAKS